MASHSFFLQVMQQWSGNTTKQAESTWNGILTGMEERLPETKDMTRFIRSSTSKIKSSGLIITRFDANGQPMANSSNVFMIERTYDGKGNMLSETKWFKVPEEE